MTETAMKPNSAQSKVRLRLCTLSILTLCGLIDSAAAQQTSPLTRVSFFNALPSDVRLFVEWEGREAFPDGIARGQAYGPFNAPGVGTPVKFKAEGFKEAEATLDLAPDTRRAFIVYAGPPEPQKDGGPAIRPVRVFSMPALPEAAAGKKLEWPLVLVGLAESAQVQVNGKPVAVARNKSVVVAKGERYVEVKQGDRELIAVSVEGPEDYVLVVFGDNADELAGGVVYR
jgi:hypothetical protein